MRDGKTAEQLCLPQRSAKIYLVESNKYWNFNKDNSIEGRRRKNGLGSRKIVNTVLPWKLNFCFLWNCWSLFDIVQGYFFTSWYLSS